jgi:uncharacterized membrane protein YfhO
VTELGLNRLLVDVEATGDALLVIGELFLPGWRATVDGTPAPLIRADAIFRGVRVPGGRHQVELRYFTPGLRPGLYLSAGALGLLGLVFIGSLGGSLAGSLGRTLGRDRFRGGKARG